MYNPIIKRNGKVLTLYRSEDITNSEPKTGLHGPLSEIRNLKILESGPSFRILGPGPDLKIFNCLHYVFLNTFV